MTTSHVKLAFVASSTDLARQCCGKLRRRYGNVPPAEADVIIALGGDGFILRTLQRFLAFGKPIFGMNRGSVGFLMNDYRETDLLERLMTAEVVTLHPLQTRVADQHGSVTETLAFNEVALLRRSRRMARIAIEINGTQHLEFAGDGIIIATPAGSTAYNFSAGGPILPLGAQVLALTPISPFRPRHWRGALVRHDSLIRLRSLGPSSEPVGLESDHFEVFGVVEAEIREDRRTAAQVLFDRGHSLHERALREQFIQDRPMASCSS